MSLGRSIGRVRQFFNHRAQGRLVERRMASNIEYALPDFVIVGVMKCGTTSLFNHLISHPCIAEPLVKGVKYYNKSFDRGEGWYRAHFPAQADLDELRAVQGIAMTGESSPDYLPNPDAAKRLKALTPDAKLILLLRDPVTRAFSHYHYRKVRGRESLSFEQAVENNLNSLKKEQQGVELLRDHANYTSYLGRGLYMPQLRHWFEEFPKEQFLVVSSEDFSTDAQSVYADVTEFLNLPAHSLINTNKHNTGKYKKMANSTRQDLIDYFRPHNQELFKFAGREFDWQS